MNDWCVKEEKRIKDYQCYFEITKVKVRRSSRIEGVDSLGNECTFDYVNIIPLDQHAEPGDILIKESGTMEFKLLKGKREYIILYDCKTNGKVVDINYISDKP